MALLVTQQASRQMGRRAGILPVGGLTTTQALASQLTLFQNAMETACATHHGVGCAATAMIKKSGKTMENKAVLVRRYGHTFSAERLRQLQNHPTRPTG